MEFTRIQLHVLENTSSMVAHRLCVMLYVHCIDIIG